jgi:hypothetical protein
MALQYPSLVLQRQGFLFGEFEPTLKRSYRRSYYPATDDDSTVRSFLRGRIEKKRLRQGAQR